MSDFPNSHLHNVILNVVTSLKNMTKLCFSSCIYWYTLDLVCGSRYSRTGIITEVLIMQWWHIAQHTAQQYRILWIYHQYTNVYHVIVWHRTSSGAQSKNQSSTKMELYCLMRNLVLALWFFNYKVCVCMCEYLLCRYVCEYVLLSLELLVSREVCSKFEFTRTGEVMVCSEDSSHPSLSHSVWLCQHRLH